MWFSGLEGTYGVQPTEDTPQTRETIRMEAQSITERNPFATSTTKFEELVKELGDEELLGVEHGDIEALLKERGRELLRVLAQDHFALRAPAVPVEGEVTGSDGETRRYARYGMSLPMTTIFGGIKIGRVGFRGEGVGALMPLDAVLNLPPNKYSHGVRREVAELVAKNSFEDVAATLSKSTGAPVPKRQVEEMAQGVAVDFDAYYEQRSASAVVEAANLLVVGFDGTGVHMRPEALREATRKRREEAVPEDRWPAPMKTGPKRNNGTRSAMVSVCYEVEPYPRNSQDILRDLRGIKVLRDGDRASRPKPQAKRVSASLEKSVRRVVREGFAEALRRDPDKKKRPVALLDGNEHQLECVQTQARSTGVELTVVIDFIHVSGYVWGAAKVLHPDNFTKRREWVMEKLTTILGGRANVAAAAMRRSATMLKLGDEERKLLDQCANYLLKYQVHLRYDEALAEGLPITTGVIEGACRHLVKDRMAITGARWGLHGGEAVLRLRALVLTGDLDDYLEFHKACELKRNHLSRYESGKVPDLKLPLRREPLLRVVQ